MLRYFSVALTAVLLFGIFFLAAPAAQAGVVINEIWNGTSTDEWVEFYNNSTTTTVDVSGWTFVRRTNAATSDATLYTFPGALNSSTTVIPIGGYYSIGDAGTGFTLDGTYTNAISTAQQSVALMSGATQMDGLATGGTAGAGAGTLAHAEGTILSVGIASGSDCSRYTNGTDTNNNNADFVVNAGTGFKTFKLVNLPVELSNFSAE